MGMRATTGITHHRCITVLGHSGQMCNVSQWELEMQGFINATNFFSLNCQRAKKWPYTLDSRNSSLNPPPPPSLHKHARLGRGISRYQTPHLPWEDSFEHNLYPPPPQHLPRGRVGTTSYILDSQRVPPKSAGSADVNIMCMSLLTLWVVLIGTTRKT